MKWYNLKFDVKGKYVVTSGIPELEGSKGFLCGDSMAIFFGRGKSFYVANTITGKLRQMSSETGFLLVEASEIDYNAIAKVCQNGFDNAVRKSIQYESLNRYDGYKGGLCALSWMLYPDGIYFADEDGFGMEDNDEENVYAIIDTNLDIIEPFRPIKDIVAYLKEIRQTKKEEVSGESGEEVKTIYNLIIMDESGSMKSIEKEAIDSVNETIQSIRSAQKKYANQTHYITLVTFNDYVKTICDRVRVDDVTEMNVMSYNPACCTALYIRKLLHDKHTFLFFCFFYDFIISAIFLLVIVNFAENYCESCHFCVDRCVLPFYHKEKKKKGGRHVLTTEKIRPAAGYAAPGF